MKQDTTSIPNPNLSEFELSMAMRGKSLDEHTDSVADKVARSLICIILEKRVITLYLYLSKPSKATKIISYGVYPITSIIPSAVCYDDNLNPLLDSCRNSRSLIIIFIVLVVKHSTCEKCEGWKTIRERLKGICSKVWNSWLLGKIFNYILMKLIFKFGAILIDLIIS